VDLTVCGAAVRALSPVREALVFLDAPPSDRGLTNLAVTLDQRDCDFAPRFQWGRSGAPLIVRNRDPVLHVTRFESWRGTNAPASWWSVAAPYAGFVTTNALPVVREPTWLRAGNVNGHDWMQAWIAVVPHPWATLTDARGEFTLRAVPVGPQTVWVWHPLLGARALPVTVQTGTTTRIELVLPANP
jgi:hypothetical protein